MAAHLLKNPPETLSVHTTVVKNKNVNISVSFPSMANDPGFNMRALKTHYPCTVAENLSRNSHCLHNAQISISFPSTATAPGSNMRALTPASSSLHRCRKPPPTLYMLAQMVVKNKNANISVRSRQWRPPLDLTCVR